MCNLPNLLKRKLFLGQCVINYNIILMLILYDYDLDTLRNELRVINIKDIDVFL